MPPQCVRKRESSYSPLCLCSTIYTHDLLLIVLSRNKLRNSAVQIPGKRKSINAFAKLPRTESNVLSNHHKFFRRLPEEIKDEIAFYLKIYLYIHISERDLKNTNIHKGYLVLCKSYRCASRLLIFHPRKRTLKQTQIERMCFFLVASRRFYCRWKL